MIDLPEINQGEKTSLQFESLNQINPKIHTTMLTLIYLTDIVHEIMMVVNMDKYNINANKTEAASYVDFNGKL